MPGPLLSEIFHTDLPSHFWTPMCLSISSADNLFGLRIPIDRAAEPFSDATELTDGGGALADVEVCDRLLAGLDAVEPVVPVIVRDVEVGVARLERGALQ